MQSSHFYIASSVWVSVQKVKISGREKQKFFAVRLLDDDAFGVDQALNETEFGRGFI